MLCPKCGFNSFDHNATCPRCGKDLSHVREVLHLSEPKFRPVNFFTDEEGSPKAPHEFSEPLATDPLETR
jgi:predicted amidophosphoribosyltransferase